MKRTGYIFNKLILSYVIMILITILVLSLILYVNFENISLDSINKYTTATLSQTSYSLVYMKEIAMNFGMQKFFDADVMDLMYNREFDYQQLVKVLNRLQSDISVNSAIYSVYIYNGLQNQIYSSRNSTTFDGNEFFDKTAVSIIKSGNADQNLVPIPRMVFKFPENILPRTYVNVYTFVIFDKSVNKNSSNSAVVININQDWLKNIIEANRLRKEGKIVVVDHDGNVAFSTQEDLFCSSLAGEEYVKRTLASKSPNGFFISKVKGEDVIINYTSSGVFDWKFISITPYRLIKADIDRMKRITFFVCICILLLGLAASYIIARRMNAPVREMMNRINTLEDMRSKERELLRTDVWKKLLTQGPEVMNKTLGELNSEFNLGLDKEKSCGVFVLKLDNFDEFCRQNDLNGRAQKLQEIKAVITGVLGDYPEHQVFEMTEEIIAVVFLCNTDKTNSTGKGIQSIVDRITIIQKDVFERMAISLTASFGGICEDASQIRELYVRAINNSHYRLVLGHMSVITDDRIPNRNHAGFKYPGEKEEALLGSLKAGKLDKAVENYDAIISQALGFSYSEVYQTVMKLLFSINSVKDEIEKNLHVTLDYSVFGVDVLKYETVAQINSYYYDLFEKLTGIVEEKKNKKKENIITNVIEMINRDYRKQNICLESVAEMVNLTPAYLGRMFKEQTLKSVGEYILEKRLEEAVGMLKGNQYTINEISERVGFVSPNYFFAVFKKAYGITPGEYRNNKLSDR